jgi:hypothetical protein
VLQVQIIQLQVIQIPRKADGKIKAIEVDWVIFVLQTEIRFN